MQILLLIRQMEASGTQANAANLSELMVAQQAIMDALICLANLTSGGSSASAGSAIALAVSAPGVYYMTR